jgi:hypothetical protein
MAAFDDSAWLGVRQVRLTDDDLDVLTNWSRGLGAVDVGNAWRYAGFFILPLFVFSTINDDTVEGLAYVAPVPFKVVGAHVGAEAAAGSAATGMIEVDRAGAGSWADLCEADVDIKSDVKTMQPLAITNGSEDIDAGDELRLSVTGTGAGAVVGSQAQLFCYRR